MYMKAYMYGMEKNSIEMKLINKLTTKLFTNCFFYGIIYLLK